jgi:bifunctional NMN adenylyltransferase/nudix hydrolase
MLKKHKYCVFIGRFQPFHKNHQAILENALKYSEKVIVLIGTANRPRTIKNPFTASERVSMIRGVTDNDSRVLYGYLNDFTYNDQKWAMHVQNVVDQVILSDNGDPDFGSIAITGNKEDYTSWYIDMFPQWHFISPAGFDEELSHLHATALRDRYFKFDYFEKFVPPTVFQYLQGFTQTPEFKQLVQEYFYIKGYKESWAVAPYPVTFLTTDAVVIQSGHILLVKRRAEPGKGLYALPGGFLNQEETLIDGMLRELREETKIKVPMPVLRGCIKRQKVYDAPERSLRGRTVTNAFLIELPNCGDLPRVKGADDAEKAFWLPISELEPDRLFEDHYDIITDLLGI